MSDALASSSTSYDSFMSFPVNLQDKMGTLGGILEAMMKEASCLSNKSHVMLKGYYSFYFMKFKINVKLGLKIICTAGNVFLGVS